MWSQGLCVPGFLLCQCPVLIVERVGKRGYVVCCACLRAILLACASCGVVPREVGGRLHDMQLAYSGLFIRINRNIRMNKPESIGR